MLRLHQLCSDNSQLTANDRGNKNDSFEHLDAETNICDVSTWLKDAGGVAKLQLNFPVVRNPLQDLLQVSELHCENKDALHLSRHTHFKYRTYGTRTSDWILDQITKTSAGIRSEDMKTCLQTVHCELI